MRLRSLAPALVLAACSAPLAFGSAFAISELGARAAGMGGAFVAVADDPTAIFFNPAGIAFVKGTQMDMNNLVVVGLFRFVPSNPSPGLAVPQKGFSGTIHTPFIPVASMYMTKQMSDKMTFGFGAYTPFGLAANFTNFNDGDPPNTKYPGRWAGTRAKLESYWFQPTVGMKVTDNFSVGFGIALVHTHLFLQQSFLNPNDTPNEFSRGLAAQVFPGVEPNAAYRSFARLLPEGRLRAAATGKAPGFAGGMLYNHRKSKTKFGMSWRSPVVSHLNGKAAFSFTSSGSITPFLPAGRTLTDLFPDQKIKGTFTTPGNYLFGVSRQGWRDVLFAIDFQIQDFRRFKDLPLNFEKTVDAKGLQLATPAEQRLDFSFRNSYLLHAGMEKQLKSVPGFIKGRMMRDMMKDVTVRVGYSYDYSPVVDRSVGPLFPDSSRHNTTMGMTKRKGNLDMTLFYQAMQMVNRTVEVPGNVNLGTNGEYRNFAHLAGASMRYHMGGRKD